MYVDIDGKPQLEKIISEAAAKMEHLPKGKIISVKDRCYTKWFWNIDDEYTYLSRRDIKNKKLIGDLVYKKYLQCCAEEAQNEIAAIDAYLEKHHSGQRKSEEMLASGSPYRSFLAERLSELPADAAAWADKPYEKYEAYPERLKYEVTSGLLVRSKSEALIAESLLQCGIPFRYECALRLDGITYHPDFTIMHPETKQIYYWEHLGLMGSPDYIDKSFRKLAAYAKHGISPMTNLILSYEDLSHPLTQVKIYELLSHTLEI